MIKITEIEVFELGQVLEALDFGDAVTVKI